MKKKPAAPAFPERQPIHGEDDFRAWLRAWCERDTHKFVAQRTGLSPSHLSQILSGKGTLGPKTVARFGYERRDTTTFIPLPKDGKE